MRIILRATVRGVEMVKPVEHVERLPRIGEHLGDSYGEIFAIVTMVTHCLFGEFYYPGSIMRSRGIESDWGISCKFDVIVDVTLREDYYRDYDPEVWHSEAGWDRMEWLRSAMKPSESGA